MQKQWMKVSCAAAAALTLAAPLSGYAMPRVADAGLVMTVTGEANRLLANDHLYGGSSAPAGTGRQ